MISSKIELLSNFDLQYYCNRLHIPIKAVTLKIYLNIFQKMMGHIL